MAASLKIAVNTRLLLGHRMEGIARFIHEITRRMVEAHPEIEFHFLFDRPYDKKFIYADNVVPHVLFPQSRHPVLWYWWFEFSVFRFLEGNGIDVFFSGDMYLSLRTKVPTVYVSHDLNYLYYPEALRKSHLKYMRKNFPLFHRRADHIIAVSEFTRNDIIKNYTIPGNKISVAYNDVPSGFRPFTSEEKQDARDRFTGGSKYFIYVGSLHPRKNLVRLLRAFDLFKDSDKGEVCLVIYGRKAFKTGDIFKVYREMKYAGDVVFIDQSQASVPEILPGAEALVYPSLFEGFGIPILEAFHSEVPVISSNVSSMPEVSGEAALLVNPESVEEIARALLEVLDPGVREKLLDAAATQKELFSWERSAGIVWDSIDMLIKKP